MKKEEKKVKQKVPVEYNNIDPVVSSKVCEMIDKSVKFQMPKGGIHKPMIWRNKKGQWGILYRIYAIVPDTKISSIKATKYMVMQLKWTAKRGYLVPNKGYETLIAPIDNEYNLLFQGLK